MSLPERPEFRIGDRERELVIEQLRVHVGDGRLTMDEFEERTGAALAARTSGDLERLIADLPAVPRATTKGPPIRRTEKVPAHGWDLAWQIHYRVALVLSVAFLLVALLFFVGWPFWVIFGVGVSVGVHGAVKWAVQG